ncbi:sensor histidine kinase [Pseudomonas sp. GD03842]|uniref:sensor histidine kinase n=1 Tax=unclassified Pseudomonas TaxID=196821 RepID=UPI000D3CE5BD|nr:MULTISPECIES: sensor histidine kinase [unclassified Pseudomonas]MDH0748678.1 sensor histidine kinase [Pseudomonas sp. GD03842]RAU44331.1 sensor histidine kinase [Pseudomonas sp. RIT 409]RAU51022.1 sensor histidine kinase [Pseudomonas sp. RIT 412]
MHGSNKTFNSRTMGSINAFRWAAGLCLLTTVCNSAFWLLGSGMPLSLGLLNGLACLCVGYCLSRPNHTIQFQPQELADHMLQVQETERHRLSRELHDDIGQMLTAAKLQSDWLQRRAGDDLQPHCTLLSGILDETLAKVRDVSAILNPRQLTTLGLEASLRAHLRQTLADTPVRWSLECHQQLAGIPEEMSVAAFRITQEAVTNMLRHAQAKNLRVHIQRRPEGLALSIADDGAGFVPASNPGQEGQRGMAGMLERATLLGGHLTVDSQPGNGTHIHALFPWAPRVRGRAEITKPS